MLRLRLVWLHVITTAEEFLEPDVQTNKKIAATHLLNLEFGFASSPVAPRDRNYCPRVSTHDGLERKLHCKVEVWSNSGRHPSITVFR
jgi:hypothetical protein